MTDFHRHVADYLLIRRSLGFRLQFCARVLPQLGSYLEASGASVLTAEVAVSRAGLPEGVQPIVLAHRLGAARVRFSPSRATATCSPGFTAMSSERIDLPPRFPRTTLSTS